MQMQSIPVDESLKSSLLRNIREGRLAHATLLNSSLGGSGLPLALSLAQYIHCQNPTEDDTCGTCSGCVKSAKLVHPDTHFSFPVIKAGNKKREDTTSRDFLPQWRETILDFPYFDMEYWMSSLEAESKAANINTTDIESFSSTLGLQTFESKSKVLIIWMAEYLGRAGNKLLKLIEEPPDGTYIFLIATDTSRILGTIISRCQILNLPNISVDLMASILSEKYGLTSDQSLRCAELSQGNLSRARLMAQGQYTTLSTEFISWLRASYCFERDPSSLVQWVDVFSRKAKNDQRSFLYYGISFLRKFHLASYLRGFERFVDESELDSVNKLKILIDQDTLYCIVDEIERTLYGLERNLNIKTELMSRSITIGSRLKVNRPAKV